MREADSHGGSWTAAAVPRQAPWRRPGLRWLPWLTLGVIAAGGVAGALARQGLWAVFPREAGLTGPRWASTWPAAA